MAVQGTKTTALQYFITYFGDRGDKVEESEAMECLGSLGLRGRVASATPVEGLSGGQKVTSISGHSRIVIPT
jgi:ATPase subunit of ABC transporter with duplicated ATPase domains